jgi:diguanylate cyclase (GGDEF)-like protein/PAS domain S-box-containing protein
MTWIRGHARALLDAAPDAMIITDLGGSIIYANDQAEALFGYARREMLGKPVEMLLPERFRAGHPALRLSYANNPSSRAMGETRLLYAKHQDSSEFRAEVRLSTLETDEGIFISSIIRDISARAELSPKTSLPHQGGPAEAVQAQQMIEARERAVGTLDSIGDAVISNDSAGNVIYLNALAERLTGWSRAEAVGRPLHQVFAIVDDGVRESVVTPLQSAMQRLDIGGTLAGAILTGRDGSEFAIEHSAALMANDRGESIGAVVVFRDVSAARIITSRLAYAAQHDPLTGLPNRLLLLSRLTQAIALARRRNNAVAVLFLDLDGFKLINDSLGHPVGDRLLESVASLLQRCVRDADTVSRLGGDEFVVLLSEISYPADAAVVAQKILDALRMPHMIDDQRLMVTASIGIGVYPDHGTDPQALLHNADEAMFRAKRPGGNGYRIWS